MTNERSSTTRTLYLVAALLASIALGLGLWDLLVEQDGGGDIIGQIVLPGSLLLLMLWLFRKERREGR